MKKHRNRARRADARRVSHQMAVAHREKIVARSLADLAEAQRKANYAAGHAPLYTPALARQAKQSHRITWILSLAQIASVGVTVAVIAGLAALVVLS